MEGLRYDEYVLTTVRELERERPSVRRRRHQLAALRTMAGNECPPEHGAPFWRRLAGRLVGSPKPALSPPSGSLAGSWQAATTREGVPAGRGDYPVARAEP
jgi:hypothetical protein